jgi:hypothetical protein
MSHESEHVDELLRERAHRALDDLTIASALRVPGSPAGGRRITAHSHRSQRMVAAAAGVAAVAVIGALGSGLHVWLGSRPTAMPPTPPAAVSSPDVTPGAGGVHITFHADPHPVQRPLGAAVAPDGTLYETESAAPDGSSPARIVRLAHGVRESVSPADFGLTSATNSPSYDLVRIRVTAEGDLVVLVTSEGNIGNFLFRVTPLGDVAQLYTFSSVTKVRDGLAVDAAGDIFLGTIGCRCGSGNSGDSVIEFPVGGGSRLVVGTGSEGAAVADGSLATAGAVQPWGLAVGPDGALYIADAGDNRVRRVGPDGIVTTVAGTGAAGSGGDGGPATAAQLDQPESIAFNAQGALVIADTGNNRIREAVPRGTIHTIAGDGTAGTSGNGGAAVHAQLHQPAVVAALPDGSVFMVEGDTVGGASDARRVLSDGTITSDSG